MDMHYPNLRAFMKRHRLNIGDIATIIKKSYPAAHQKITRKATSHGKVSLFDIEEAYTLIQFAISTEQNRLKQKYEDSWIDEWNARWGHIKDWFGYIFFDEVVTNVTNSL